MDLFVDPSSGSLKMEELTQSDVASFAEALRARSSTRLRDLWRFSGVTEERKMERATIARDKIVSLRSALEKNLDDADPKVRQLVDALQNGDMNQLRLLGLDAQFAWIDDVVTAMLSGDARLTIEVARPVPSANAVSLAPDGTLQVRPLLDLSNRPEFLLNRLFTELTAPFSNVETCIPVFDFSTGSVVVSEERRDLELLGTYASLRNAGVVHQGDVAGERFILLPQTVVLKDVDELIARLEESGAGFIATHDSGAVTYRPSQRHIEVIGLSYSDRRDDLSAGGIELKAAGGVPTEVAIGAAGYLHPACPYLLEFNVLDKRCSDQEENVYMMLRAIEVTSQERYHTMFYSPELLSPDLIAYATCRIFEQGIERYLYALTKSNSWEVLNPEEHALRVYPDRILEDDKDLMNFTMKKLSEAGVDPGGLSAVASVDTGANLYPAMMMAPWVSEFGSVDVIESSPAVRAYLDGTIAEHKIFGNIDPWQDFEAYMKQEGGEVYDGAFARLCKQIHIVDGSIFSLPRGRYEAATAFFSIESIAGSPRKFRESIRSLSNAVKSTGYVVAAHALGSQRSEADGSKFPVLRVGVSDIEEAYREIGLNFEIHVTNTKAGDGNKTPDGNEGVAIVIARHFYSTIGSGERELWKTAPAVLDEHNLKIWGHPVMEAWERPYMQELARIATLNGGDVLEIGFGMGISAGFIESADIKSHTIIEANQDIAKLAREFCAKAPHPARVLEGLWDEVIDEIPDGSLDGILYDAYPLTKAEVAQQVRFATVALRKLKPGGVFTYFSDEVVDLPPQHIDQLRLAGAARENIDFTVIEVDPPPHCQYWHWKTVVAPIVRK